MGYNRYFNAFYPKMSQNSKYNIRNVSDSVFKEKFRYFKYIIVSVTHSFLVITNEFFDQQEIINILKFLNLILSLQYLVFWG